MRGAFLTGALGYPALELLWRGRTHWSMAVAGGASMALIRQIGKLPLSRTRRALLCGAGITAVEYAAGRLWNRDFRVWDYRRTPLNVQGQICLPYTLVWCAISAGVLTLTDAAGKRKKAGQP